MNFFGCQPTAAPSTTTIATTTIETTTIDTPGTLKSTSSYPNRQALDECGGICYPGSLPNGTSLSNCTITFTGLKAGAWYAVAIQVRFTKIVELSNFEAIIWFFILDLCFKIILMLLFNEERSIFFIKNVVYYIEL
jgi:hypothetical protein